MISGGQSLATPRLASGRTTNVAVNGSVHSARGPSQVAQAASSPLPTRACTMTDYRRTVISPMDEAQFARSGASLVTKTIR